MRRPERGVGITLWTGDDLGGGPSTQSAQVAYRILRDLGVPVLPYHYGVGA